MSKEVRKKWAVALRSGKYKQGKYYLRDADDNFCCLGVLCELAAKENIIPEPVLMSGRYEYAEGRTGYLPSSVREWAGIDNTDPNAISRNEASLISLNDSGTPFSEIANIIEQGDADVDKSASTSEVG